MALETHVALDNQYQHDNIFLFKFNIIKIDNYMWKSVNNLMRIYLKEVLGIYVVYGV